MIIEISMGLETCQILGQVSHNLLYWKKNLPTDICGPVGDGPGVMGSPKGRVSQQAAADSQGSPNLRVCKHPTRTGWHTQGGE